jgi:multidrug efflux system membrane fusion protein
VLVRPRVDGQIMKIHFTEGQIVQSGDLLVEIDPRPFKAALDQANAKKQQDLANIENAKRDLVRYQSLAKSDFATRQQLDTQTATVAQLTAQIAADDAAIETAQTQLDYTTIRAPLTGRTGFRLVDEGNIVNASSATGIVSIAQIEPIAVVFTAPENTLPQITAGLKANPLDVKAFSSDGGTLLADGRLEVFNNEIDTASGTIRLKAAFRNEDHKLWPGLSVSTKLEVAVRDGAVIVPAAAVQRSQAGLYAFVIGQDNKVEQRPIKVTLSDDDHAVVDSGIKAGEQVVVAGQYRLQAGTLVKAAGSQDSATAKRES